MFFISFLSHHVALFRRSLRCIFPVFAISAFLLLPLNVFADEDEPDSLVTLLSADDISLSSPWIQLEKGLEFHLFSLNESGTARLAVLRIDPEYYEFRLHTVSELGGRPRSLRRWAQTRSLTAAINAAMYLPDYKTSTAYLRQDNHINNGRIVRNYSSFFQAEPMNEALPRAQVCDREVSPCRERIEEYRCVVQNFRIIDGQRHVAWNGFDRAVPISAIGKDGSGRILFMHCREAVKVRVFAKKLLELPIDVRGVMYVEGGAQAGLMVATEKLTHLWAGRHAADVLTPVADFAPLPNILGITPRKRKDGEQAK